LEKATGIHSVTVDGYMWECFNAFNKNETGQHPFISTGTKEYLVEIIFVPGCRIEVLVVE